VDAVGEIDVDVCGWAEHDSVAWGRTIEGVGGSIVVTIGLGLDNPAADAIHGKPPSDEIVGNGDSVSAEKTTQAI
jgi:hypothetical protein